MHVENTNIKNCRFLGVMVLFKRRREISGGTSGGHDASGMMRWLLTYSDLITLLMIFFVVMYAMSAADKKKFDSLKASLQVALRTDTAGVNPIMDYAGERLVDQSAPLENGTENDEFRNIANQVLNNVGDPKQVMFVLDERGLTIRFMDNVLFDSGKASIRPEGDKLLDAVGAALKNSPNYIRVEGHADNVPINNAQFPSNWELSATRSIAVTRYIIEKNNMDAHRFSSLGYGEYHPLYPNTSEENRAKNRRVDIVVLRTERAGGEIK
jgi:chemotaxis protein MotB